MKYSLLALSLLITFVQVVRAAPDPGPTHPLDALTEAEIRQAVDLLKRAGDADEDTVYPAVTLRPPDKEQIKQWKPGQSFTRSAFVVLRKNLVTYEALVDLTNKKVVSNTAASGAQPMILDREWFAAKDKFQADQRFKDAIAKRGLKEADVFCTPNSAGAFPGDGLENKRILKIPCFSKSNTASPMTARPIEGLMGIVDTDSGQVIDVMDHATVPMPQMPVGWGETLPKQGTLLKPVAIVAPAGSNITVSGNYDVKWQNWSLHLRPDKRAGLILNLIRFKDGERWRDVAYQLNLSELFVPYMDPDPTWSYRTFMDAGEFGLGYQISTLRPGVDCPIDSYYFHLTFPNDIGGTYTRPNALCIFERATGDPAWRHYSHDSKEVVGLPQTEMVIRHAPTVGNYDYLVDYVYSPQGNITLRVGASGFDAIRSSTAKSMEDAAAVSDTAYGTLIAPYTVAPNHDHFFSFRLDLDVDGAQNALVRDTIVPGKAEGGGLRTSVWTRQTDRYTAEGPIAEDHMSAGEAWRVINPNTKNAIGQNPGYWIDMHHQPKSVLDRADPPQRRAGFSTYTLWATQAAEGEDWAAGLYPNLSKKDQGLPAFVSQKRSIDNQDLVVWYTMGFRHIPRPEDFPVMPVMWHEMTLRPVSFFDRDPSYTFNPGALPNPKTGAKK